MRVTVATVCFNCENTIEETIKSVLSQTYEDIEYIIIDGDSKDDTMQIVRAYEANNKMVVVSEPDKGLYDAMNKAADMATGQYILYMNSGDLFADKHAVENVAPFLKDNYELVYGNVIRCRKDGEHLEKYHGYKKDLRMALQGRMMCHQSIFTRTDVMRKYRFDLSFSITADYDFVLRLMHDKKTLKYVDVTVSKVDSIEGISSLVSNMDKMREQDDKSLKKNFPVLYTLVTPPKALIRFIRRKNEKRVMNQ